MSLSSDTDGTSSASDEMSTDQRDLSPEEMDKLVQLQDLTGIDDLQICRALLESKNWDLEATAREHLNMPGPGEEHQRPRPFPDAPPEAPEARNVIRPPNNQPNIRRYLSPGGNNNNNRRGVVPVGHSLFSWGVYLLTLPLRIAYKTVSSVCGFVLGIVGIGSAGAAAGRRPRLAAWANPEQDVAEFVRNFAALYGANHVAFHVSSYADALEVAKRDLRFLLVYLHAPDHQDTRAFCERVLTSEAVRSFVSDNNVIVWACSVDSAEGCRVSQALCEHTYPFLALIVLRQNRMMVVGRVEGLVEPELLADRLRTVVRDNEAYIVAAQAERTERHINAEIRQEQDAAFQETLRVDQERERQKREAEEAKKQAEAEERRRVEAEADRRQEIRRLKIELASEVPDEPLPDAAEAVRILIKLPGGQRLDRRFRRHESLKCLYYFVFCHPDSPDEFDVTTNFPRKVLQCKPVEGEDDPPTFEEAGLGHSTTLFVNDLEA